MIQRSIDYSIHCDKCGEPLMYEKDHPLTVFIFHIMKEDTVEHIKEVAESYGWEIAGDTHFCSLCK